MELPFGGVEICPVNFPSPLAALSAVQSDGAGVATAVTASKRAHNNAASIVTEILLKTPPMVKRDLTSDTRAPEMTSSLAGT